MPLACLLSAACGEPDACATLAPEAAGHLTDFDRFEAVATRIVAADSAFDDRSVLEESLFFSLRDAPEVLGAWVQRTGPAPISLAHPRRAEVPTGPFTRCRVEGGALWVARTTITVGDSPGPALVLQRVSSEPPQEVSVTMAFVVP